MNKSRMLVVFASVCWLAGAGALQAGNLVFKFRDNAGNVHDVTNMADVRRLTTDLDGQGRIYITDYNAYAIMKKYIEDVKSIKDRAGDMSFDTTVIISADLNQTYPGGSKKTGSWSSGDGKTIQIQTWDRHRMISTLAHEVAHSYMRDKCGKNPTQGMTKEQKYGADGDHYVEEVTTPQTALSEGYAEYHGDRPGGGEESAGCAGKGRLESLYTEGAAQAYTPEKWKDISDPNKMWNCEGINATMLRDFAKYIPDGAAKIEELMCSSNTLQGVIAAWAKKYPNDANALAKIIDANTNFTMDKETLRSLLQGNANDYLDKERAAAKTKYEDKNPCDSVKEMFRPPAGGLPPPGGAGGGTTPGTGAGGGEKWRGLKKY
jgi:hypothetical protein